MLAEWPAGWRGFISIALTQPVRGRARGGDEPRAKPWACSGADGLRDGQQSSFDQAEAQRGAQLQETLGGSTHSLVGRLFFTTVWVFLRPLAAEAMESAAIGALSPMMSMLKRQGARDGG